VRRSRNQIISFTTNPHTWWTLSSKKSIVRVFLKKKKITKLAE
jgi:hypothetical protein